MARKVSYMGMMSAIIFILSLIEHSLPPIPFLPPNVKLGLSNIVTMYCVFFIGGAEAVTLNILKSGFVFLTRGAMSAALSLCGGLLSVFAVILIVRIFKNKITYIIVSIIGAVLHNLGQLFAVSLILNNNFILYYFPVLLLSGVIMGIATGTLLNTSLPFFQKVFKPPIVRK